MNASVLIFGIQTQFVQREDIRGYLSLVPATFWAAELVKSFEPHRKSPKVLTTSASVGTLILGCNESTRHYRISQYRGSAGASMLTFDLLATGHAQTGQFPENGLFAGEVSFWQYLTSRLCCQISQA